MTARARPLAAATAVALVAAGGAGLAASPGSAAKRCQAPTKNPLVPRLLTPCTGATIRHGSSPTFTAFDSNSKSARYRPYLNLQASPARTDGHLPANTDGRGLFAQMSPVSGHKGRWTLTPRRQPFSAYWLNAPGTYYVQVQQIDGRAGHGSIFYSRIVTIHVG